MLSTVETAAYDKGASLTITVHDQDRTRSLEVPQEHTINQGV